MGVSGWVPGAAVKEKIAKVDMTWRRDEFWDACGKVNEWELDIQINHQQRVGAYGVVPQYIRDVLTPTAALSRRADLRSAERMEYDVPFARTLMGMRGFSVAGPSAWNRLPVELRQISTYSTFRRNFKTHLFKKSYGLD